MGSSNQKAQKAAITVRTRPHELPFLCYLQRPRRQSLAASGSHGSPSRPDCRRHNVQLSGGSFEGTATRCGRTRLARVPDRKSRSQLAGLVRRVHGARTIRRRIAALRLSHHSKHKGMKVRHSKPGSVMIAALEKSSEILTEAKGLEPAASCVTDRRSNHLNYAPASGLINDLHVLLRLT